MIVRWGVIGAGGIADKRTIPAIKECKDNRLIAVMDIGKEQTKALAEKHGAKRFYTKSEDLLADEEINSVYIATPVYLHCEQAIQAASFGKHILCEKPMALSVEDCKRMIDACEKSKVKLMIGFRMRFHPFHQRIKSLIKGGVLGEIVFIKAESSIWFQSTPDNWRLKKDLAGGGALADLGEHTIDLTRYFMGKEVTEVSAFTGNVIFDYPVEETISLILKFSSRAQGVITSSFAIPYGENLLQIYGTKGMVMGSKTIGQFPAAQLKTSIEAKVKEYHAEHIDTFKSEIEHFTDCLKNDKEPLVNGEEGLKTVRIRQAAYKSAEEKKVIKL